MQANLAKLHNLIVAFACYRHKYEYLFYFKL